MRRSSVTLIALILIGVASFAGAATSSANNETLDITLTLPTRGDVALHLERRDVFAPGSRIQIMTPSGPVSVDPSVVRVFRGSLPNEPKSFVVLAVSNSGIVGSVQAGEERFDVQRGPLATSPLLVARNEATPKECAVADEKVPEKLMRIMQEKPVESMQDAETLEIQLAIEADYQFFQRHQSDRVKALAYIAQIVGVTSAIYERDFNVRLTTSNVRLWEDANDPYPDDLNVFSLLSVFTTHYDEEMTDVPRDVAMFFTMRGGSGGVAKSIGGVCEEGLSYCAADFAGDLSKAPAAYSWDQVLLAHELGHVCGAVHTQNCFWPGGPLDSCVRSEGGTCVRDNQTSAIKGTIMSYCHQRRNDGGGIVAEFHPRHKHTVRAYIERATCVGARPAQTNNVLRGRLINATTNAGIAGAELRIRGYGDNIFKAPPALGADTIRVTAVDGVFEFSGLSDGIYTIVLPTDWAISPITINAAEQGVSVLVTDAIVQRDISVVRGRPVTMKVQTNGDATDISFVIVSETIEALSETLTVPGFAAALGVPFTRSIPVGSYTVVPMAIGRRFTPPRIDLVVTDEAPVPEQLFVSTSTAPDTTSAMVAISTMNMNGKLTLAEGDEIEMRDIGAAQPTSETTGNNGVAVFEDMTTDSYFIVKCEIDTTRWTPSRANTTYLGGGEPRPAVFEKRPRTFPLVAQPYQLAVLDAPYVQLEGAERIIPPEALASNAPITRYLTFPVKFGTTYASKLFVYPSGDLVFGNSRIGSFGPPLATYEPATFIVSTFSTSLFPDSAALAETGVWWKISGEAPNRTISVEWRKLKGQKCEANGMCVPSGTFTFQVHVEEHSGIIRMAYGEIDPEDEVVPVSVGLRGADKLDARVLAATTAEFDWSVPETQTISSDYYNIYFRSTGAPEPGLVYRWFNAAVDVASDDIGSSLHVTPTPASDELLVKGLPQGARVRLVDMMGRAVRSVHEATQTLRLNVASLPAGRYSLLVDTDAGTTAQPVLITR